MVPLWDFVATLFFFRNYVGEDHFTVLVSDSLGATREVPVTVTVDNVQDAPRFVAAYILHPVLRIGDEAMREP